MTEGASEHSRQSVTPSENASAVTILGLGNMGTAIAQTLLSEGHRVCVWNRTHARAEPLVARGATLARTPAEAVASSPITLMCVLDNQSANDILASPGVGEAFSGRTLVQLTTAIPEEVRAQQAWLTARDGHYLVGGILVFPSGIGKPDTLIVYAGNGQSFEANRSMLSDLGGTPHYLGPDPGTAIGAFFTLAAFGAGALGLFYETAAIARHFGLPMATYHGLALNITDVILREGMGDAARRVTSGQFADSLATKIDLGLAAMSGALEAFQPSEIPAIMTEALMKQLRLASTKGDGSKDVAYVVETLWSHRNADRALSVPE